jgi:hypothetical protein
MKAQQAQEWFGMQFKRVTHLSFFVPYLLSNESWPLHLPIPPSHAQWLNRSISTLYPTSGLRSNFIKWKVGTETMPQVETGRNWCQAHEYTAVGGDSSNIQILPDKSRCCYFKPNFSPYLFHA